MAYLITTNEISEKLVLIVIFVLSALQLTVDYQNGVHGEHVQRIVELE